MHYKTPNTEFIGIETFLHNQGSGTPVIPLNPECAGGTNCISNTFIGTFCGSFETSVGYDVHYFIPNLECSALGSTPCTVKVEGNVLSCSQESSCTDNISCENQTGSIIRCSGIIPNINSCSGLDATVECTGITDSDDCTSAP